MFNELKAKQLICFFLLVIFIAPIYVNCEQKNSFDRISPDRENERLFKEKPIEEKIPKKPLIEIEEKEISKKEIAKEDIKFFIKKINIRGSTIFPQEQLDRIVLPYHEKELSLKDLEEIADKITKMYHEAGYITSRAYIPPQKIEEGQVFIDIFEGKIGEIYIKGNKYFKKKFIEKDFLSLKGKILNKKDLQKALISLNRLPDIFAKLNLEPGKVEQTTDLHLLVEENFPQHIGLNFNNLGSPLTERLRYIFFYSNNSVLGYSDSCKIYFPWSDSGTIRGVNFNYDFPFIKKTRIGTVINYTKVYIGKQYAEFDTKGVSKAYSTYIEFPIFEDEKNFWDGRIVLESLNSSMKSSGETFIMNKLGVLKFILNCYTYSQNSSNSFSQEVNIAFPKFLGGSSKDDSLTSPKGTYNKFFIYNASFTRIQQLTSITSIVNNFKFQLTPDKLIGPKRFSIGGAYSVRGYPEDDISGDWGVNANIELQNSCFFLSEKIKDKVKFAVFTDIGSVFNRGSDAKNLLVGCGFGLRIATLPFTGRIDIAWPVADKPSDSDNLEIHFSLTFNY